MMLRQNKWVSEPLELGNMPKIGHKDEKSKFRGNFGKHWRSWARRLKFGHKLEDDLYLVMFEDEVKRAKIQGFIKDLGWNSENPDFYTPN